jgi:alanyl-tRNA synthetase
MLIADGVTPGNEGRGYVLRRIMRRVIRNMRILGAQDAVMREMVDASIDAMRPQYPELSIDSGRIHTVAEAEEAAFRRTLRSGITILDTAVTETRQAGRSTLSGDKAFELHDTYGFPIDLTLEIAEEQGLSVDRAGFTRLMREQQARAKADAQAKKTGHVDLSAYRAAADSAGAPTLFTGYDEVVTEAIVRGLLVNGVPVPAAGEGTELEIILDRTPFYAESGGQLPDSGRIRLEGGGEVEVYDVQTPLAGLVVHRARVRSGEITLGLGVLSEVDVERRRAISRSHTATHMVHKAFREALGESATQAGSENSPGRFRFDFAAPSAVPPSVLADVEARVNTLLIDDLPVHAEVMSMDDARRAGAMALFGEKYGDQVRVVSVGEWARELCGGTHAQRSGQLGVVKLLGESSIGAGVRRVEALVGTDAYQFLAREHLLVAQLAEQLKARPEELPDRVAGVVARLRDTEKELDRLRAGQVLQAAAGLAAAAKDVYGVAFVAHHAPDGTRADDLRKLALDVRGRIPADRPAVVAVAAAAERPLVVVAVNERGRAWRLKAGELVRIAAQTLGGGGGGKDDVAQGGGQDNARIDDALAQVEHAVGERVTQSS